MATASAYQCPFCNEFQAPSFKQLLPHIRIVHATKPGFTITCGVHGCQRTFLNMKSYDNHISQHMLAGIYPSNTSMMSNNEQCSQSSGFQIDDDIQTTNSCSEELVDSIESEQNDEDDLSPNGHGVSRCLQMNNNCQDIHEQYSTVHPAEHFKSQAAVWVLKTKECHKLTTSTMTSIIEDVTSFNQTVLSKVEMAVNSALENAGIPISSIPDLSEIFNVDGIFGRPFQGLETAYLQEKYCKQNFCFVVSIETCTVYQMDNYIAFEKYAIYMHVLIHRFYCTCISEYTQCDYYIFTN